MVEEAQPTIDRLGLKQMEEGPWHKNMPMVAYKGQLSNGVTVSLVRNGTCPRFGI